MTPTNEKLFQPPLPLAGKRRQQQREREKLLAQLVYETDAAGKPVYYAGFQDVLNQTIEPEAVTGASALQSYLVDLVVNFLHLHPDAKAYRFFYNEVGIQIGRKKWRACDIAIYQRERLKDYELTNTYMSLPPDVVVEIDTRADLSKYTYQQDYFFEKTRQLHEFGVKKVVWIFTESHPVIWESSSADTIIVHQRWDIDITLTEGMMFNLARLIEADKAGENA